jgi:hypothetical protein
MSIYGGFSVPTGNEFQRVDLKQQNSNEEPPTAPDAPSVSASETPEQMARETGASQDAFSELQRHLNTSLDTIGSRVAHPQDQMWRPPHGAEGE